MKIAWGYCIVQCFFEGDFDRFTNFSICQVFGWSILFGAISRWGHVQRAFLFFQAPSNKGGVILPMKITIIITVRAKGLL